MNTHRTLFSLAFALLLASGCGSPSLEETIKAARSSLNAGSYEESLGACDEALARCPAEGGDRSLVWQLESIRVEALAKLGSAPEVIDTLARLATPFPTQVQPALFVKLSQALKTAGALTGAISLADAGKQRFPDQAQQFTGVIEELTAAAQAGGDDAALEQLKSLGYL